MPDGTSKPSSSLGLTAHHKLTSAHDVSQFECGEESLNQYLKRAQKNQVAGHASVYVICESNTLIVRGYYSLCAASLLRNELPKNKQRNSPTTLPATLLGRLGVDRLFQGKGVGYDLLRDAIFHAIQASHLVASKVLLVHTLNAEVESFYLKAGFQKTTFSNNTLFLSLIH